MIIHTQTLIQNLQIFWQVQHNYCRYLMVWKTTRFLKTKWKKKIGSHVSSSHFHVFTTILTEVRNITLGFFTCKWLNKYRFFLSVWPGWPSSLPGVCGPVRQAACSGGPWRSSTTPWPLECLGSRNLELSQWWCAGVPPPWSEINWPCYNSH